jgi:hypothetical protein
MAAEITDADFENLAERWYAGVASVDEEQKLWVHLAGHPGHAAQFSEMARFHLLLEDTLAQKASESVVQTQLQRQQRIVAMKRQLKVAAAICLLGTLLWWAGSQLTSVNNQRPEVTQAKPASSEQKGPARPPTATKGRARPAPLFVATGQPDGVLSDKPLHARLDDFLLPGVSIHDMTLSEAVSQVKEQLRTFNIRKDSALNQINIRYPASAANERVSLVTGPISFSKAVQALSALAGLHVSENLNGFDLERVPGGSPTHLVTRSLDSYGLGISADEQGASRLLQQARSLGITVSDSSTLTGTAGQFTALSVLNAAQQQLASLPPSKLLLLPANEKRIEPDRVLSITEANAVLELAIQTGQPVIEVTVDHSAPAPQRLANASASDYEMTVLPVGERNGMLITFEPMISPLKESVGKPSNIPAVAGIDLLAEAGTGGRLNLTRDSGTQVVGPLANNTTIRFDGASVGSTGVTLYVDGTSANYFATNASALRLASGAFYIIAPNP